MAEIDQSGGGGKKGNKKVRAKKASTKIDMTPMVDLGFLLITFFMLTTTLLKPVAMQLSMPDKTDDEQKSEVKMSETITACPTDGKVYYYQGLPNDPNTQLLAASFDSKADDAIRKILFEYKQRIGENFTIVIKPTKDAKYKDVIDFMDECAITDSKRYALLEMDPLTEELIKKSGK
jgi:biopolymer transport protein ExbD